MTKAYHHGDLRRAVLEAAAEVISREGPSRFSLRSLAGEIGVSHTAPLHHFGSREGVLNALAVEGFGMLADALEVAARSGSFADVGVAYVDFAVVHPGHFAVMFTPDLLDATDPELVQAQGRTGAQLTAGSAAYASDPEQAAAVAISAWSVVHGLATLVLSRALDATVLRQAAGGGDLSALARRVLTTAFPPPPHHLRSTS